MLLVIVKGGSTARAFDTGGLGAGGLDTGGLGAGALAAGILGAMALGVMAFGTIAFDADTRPTGAAPADHLVVLAEFFETNRIHAFDGASGEHLRVIASGDLIKGPIGMTLGPDGGVYIANATTSDVVRLESSFDQRWAVERFAVEGLTNPYDLAVSPDGELFVTSLGSNKIVRFDGATGELLGIFASGGPLDWPEGLTFGPNGDLYVSSSRANRVLRYDTESAELLETLDTGEALAAPAGLLFDETGRLLIASSNNHTIFRFDDGKIETLVPPGTAEMKFPRFLSFGPDGLLYVSAGKRLLRFDAESGAFVDEFAVTETSIATGFVFVPSD